MVGAAAGLVESQAAGYPVGVEDFGSTTAVIAYVRRRVTPAMLWSAIGVLVTTLTVSITWTVNMSSDMRQFKESVAESKKSMADMQQQLELMHKIDTRQAVMDSKIDTMTDELSRLRARWDRVDEVMARRRH